jgi:hypothetical protein
MCFVGRIGLWPTLGMFMEEGVPQNTSYDVRGGAMACGILWEHQGAQ